MGSSFEFSALAIPHLLLGVGILGSAILNVLTRGDAVLRAGFLLVGITAFPYAACNVINITTTDPELANAASRLFVGAIALLGPALMFVLLAMTGRLERYRWLVVFAFVVAGACAVVTWATELAIHPESWVTSAGMYFHKSKPFGSLVVAQLVIWTVVGVVLSQRGASAPRTARQTRLSRRLVILGALVVTGASDALLAKGIGFYPFGVLPGLGALVMIIIAHFRHDLLRARGFDRAGAIELGLVAVSTSVVLGILLALDELEIVRTPGLVVGLVGPVLLLGQAAMLLVRRRHTTRREDREINPDLETFIELTGRINTIAELAEPLYELLAEHGGLARSKLLITGEDGRLRTLDHYDAPGVEVDERLRPWLIANPILLVIDELPTMRLGGLRKPVEDLMAGLIYPVAVPLVDRESLVGFVVGAVDAERALREGEVDVIMQAATASAKAVTYASLLREATERIEVAKEVEVASAVQQARAAGEQRLDYSGCQVIGFYQPAPQFGGHWWSSHELADGRFLIVVGDVTGTGVPAALVSFTAEGACETAQRMYGAGLEVISLLETLDASIRHIGSEYSMSCFAAIFDPSARQVTFANAGHPFPYVCRNGHGSGDVELRSLVSRGTLLGSGELVIRARTFELEPHDTVVFYSDSLVSGRSPEGDAYGERRLQRVLRTRAARAGERAADVILDAAAEFRGHRELEDDLSLIVVRMSG